MDAGDWVALALMAAVTVGVVAAATPMHRRHRRRQEHGLGTGSLSGLGAGFDAVWRPTAEEAHADWEAQQQAPAPAPLAGDKGRIDDGRIVLRIDRD